jgi:Spy/CpxP family protein refolding chaperone
MKLKILVGILVLLIVVNLAALGSFLYMQWRNPPQPEFQRMGRGPRFELNLDKSQRQQLRALLREFQTETKPINDQIHRLEDEIFELLQEDSVDPGGIEDKLKEIAALRLEISKRIVDKFRETRKFLSPVQQRHFYRSLMQVRPGPMGPGPRFQRGRPNQPLHNPPFDE